MISRKEFLTRGIFAYGCEIAGNIRSGTNESDQGKCKGKLLYHEIRCIGLTGGCFSCSESCPQGAIEMEAGTGILVDNDKCDSCGICVEICPVEPKALLLAA